MALTPQQRRTSQRYVQPTVAPVRKRLTWVDYWFFAMIGAIAITLLVAALTGCKGGNGIMGINLGGKGNAPAPKDIGQAETFYNLRGITFACLIPGILMLGASYWIKPLAKLGGVFLAVGLGAAILPYFLGQLSTPLYITLLCFAGILVITGFILLGVWVWDWMDYRKRRRALTSAILTTAATPERQRELEAQLNLLDQLYQPRSWFSRLQKVTT